MRAVSRSVRIKAAAAAVAPLLLAVTACGSDDDGGKTVEPLTAEQIKSALVVAADLPGYEVEVAEEDSEAEPEKADKPECQPILQLVAPDQGHMPKSAASATAGKPEGEGDGTVNIVGIGQFDGDQAKQFLDEAKAALAKCTQFASTDTEGGTTTYTVKEGPQLGFGDQSLVIEYDMGENGKFTVKHVRSGPVLVQAMAVTTEDGDAVVSDDIVRAQFDKLVKVQKG
ncbi:hypothetical protein LO772_23415 [Yinghuangia sp. ASG 101]|uniref:sensor domain-containing protein n=1 Tax=Yinghuangia sp. ASG 101 TaxID=2896848 RepID=UPI001E3553C4|nr:sensor domain-containing protein [Yinghuangia sp. ASG 101]UGQ09835.1 hypothetical protein LO772_23415 [Yinghuangia sp. ASG 101]